MKLFGESDYLGSKTWEVARDEPETAVQLSIIGFADVTPYAEKPIRLTLPSPEIEEMDDDRSEAHVQLSRHELERVIVAAQALLASLPEGPL